jgi:predicted Zn finger-like uncharacterized protein
MFTVCPKCALTLVVTAVDLRVAQGYVRCGRCLNVFNALARLTEERPSSAAAPPPEPAPLPAPEPSLTAGSAQGPFDAAESSLDDTGEIEIELDASAFMAATQPRAAAEETGEHEAVAEDAPPAAIAVRGPSAPDASAAEHETVNPARGLPAQDAVAEPTADLGTELVSGEHHEGGTAVSTEETVLSSEGAGAAGQPDMPERGSLAVTAARAALPPATETQQAQETNTPAEQGEIPFDIRERAPRAGLAWTIGAAVLLLALALQIVNHYRGALVADPMLRAPLSAVYSALGVKLAPHWNIHAYQVRQLGASVGGAASGKITVRASVKNSSRRPQPLPLLRVTLQDRFGNRIAARDVPPSDYLPSPTASSTLLAAGGRVDATMVFVDPGPQAVGFEIDACLRQPGGAVACAHGP